MTTAPETVTPGAPSRRAGAALTAPIKLVAFVVLLVAAIAVGWVAGGLAGPLGADAGTSQTAPAGGDHGGGGHKGTPAANGATTRAGDVGGLAVSASGYTLAPERTAFAAGVAGQFRFRVLDSAGEPVTRYAVAHEKLLHLIVVRRDLSGYQHLHPELSSEGFWAVPLRLGRPGSWRAFADFTALDHAGKPAAVKLGIDLTVGGVFTPRPLPASAAEATVEGFLVRVTGTPRAAPRWRRSCWPAGRA